MITSISVEKVVEHKLAIFIDTRTPAEFEEDHLPKAINLPILFDDERIIVGTLYKQVSKEDAIQKAVEFFAAKMPQFMKEISKYKDKEIIINCWRGGMRSRTVVALLESLNYNVKQLEGGYKAYREFVRERLEQYVLKPKLIVLWGLTCTGKTALLKHFANSLDLEGLAQHRGSLYGAIGLQPKTQKAFDNLIWQRLEELQDEHVIIVEGESRKIGEVQIPLFLYLAMLKGTHVLVKRSIKVRAREAVKEYFRPENVQKIKEVTLNLFKILGHARKEEIVKLIDERKFEEAARILLEEYYDPLYKHTLEKLKFAFEVENDEVKEGARELREKMNLLFH